MWFSFDGENFETHETEAEARELAELAMQDWEDCAGDGWHENARHVVYGKVTHAVRVEEIEVTEENAHMVPHGCEGIEHHHLEKIVPNDYRCNICGGIVSFDGTPPVPGNWGGRST